MSLINAATNLSGHELVRDSGFYWGWLQNCSDS